MVPRAVIASLLVLFLAVAGWSCRADASGEPMFPPAPAMQTQAAAAAKSAGCITCHTATDSPTMHTSVGINLGCADCHGGDAGVMRAGVIATGSDAYRDLTDKAHVKPLDPTAWNWPSSAKPRAQLHAPQSRIAGVHPLRQSRAITASRAKRAAPAISASSRRPSAA